jgi:hypothetical protein
VKNDGGKMDQSISVNLSTLRLAHFAGLPREEKFIPAIMPKRGVKAEALKSTLSAGAKTSKKMAFLSKPLSLAGKQTRISWLPSREQINNANPGLFTAAAGVGGSVGAYGGVLGGGGIYGSDSGEFGIYGTVGTLVMSNIGFSTGGQFTLMLGAPNLYFAGQALGFAVDIGFPGKVISAGGIVYFDLARYLKKDLYVCGVGFNISSGFSVLPVTLSMQYSYTGLKPLLLIK